MMTTDTEIPTHRMGFDTLLKGWVQLKALLMRTES